MNEVPDLPEPESREPGSREPGAQEPAAGEVAQLRAEVAALRARLSSQDRRAFALRALRATTAAVLVAVVGISAVASVVGVWAARTALDTDRWVAAVTPLPKDPRVAAAVARYATGEIFEVVDLDQRIRQALPEQAAFLAAPITGQVHGYVERTLNTLIGSDQFQRIWAEANRRAHRRALAVAEGRSDVVRARGDRVVIDLLPMINQVLRDLSARLPTLFGRSIDLPDLSSGAVPANLRARVSDALGVRLPDNFAQFTVYDSGRLSAVQRLLVSVRRGLAGVVLATVLLLVLALVISPARRRSVLQLGVWLVVAAIAVTAGLRAARADLLSRIPDGTYRDGVSAALTTVTATLRDRGIQLIVLGVLLAACAYLVGPGRTPVRLRRAGRVAAGAAGRGARRAGRDTTRVPGWIARHLDAVRLGAVVLAGALALALGSWVGLLVTAAALTAVEVAVTLVARTASGGTPGRPSGRYRPPTSRSPHRSAG